jgi:DNA invertase Pin-like site-specific DNA recombinase
MSTDRAAIYARVSSKKQRDQQTIEAQLRDLPVWARAMGWRVVATYVDDGVSAKSGNLAKRTGLLQMLEDASAKRFDVLVVVDIDRITRSEDVIERHLVTGTLQRAGAKIASPSTGVLDPDTFAGDMVIGVKAAASAEWLRQHRTRIKAGKASAIARNRKPAGPTPYGWTYSRATGEWSVNADQAAVVLEVLRRVADGDSCYEIARDFDRRGVPRPRGGRWISEKVWQIARASCWSGSWLADKRKRLTLSLPPIATSAQMAAAGLALARHKRHAGPRAKHTYLLERIATCRICGSRVGIASAEPSGNIRATYVCGKRRRPLPGEKPCPLHRHPIKVADERVWSAVADALGSEALAAKLLGREVGRGPNRAAEVTAAEKTLAKLDRARTVAMGHHLSGLLDDIALARHLKDIKAREEVARHALAVAEAIPDGQSPEDTRAVAEALAALQAACEAAGPERRRAIVRKLASRVVVGNHGISIGLRIPASLLRSSNRDRAGSNSQQLAGRVIVFLPNGRDMPVHRRRRVA